MKEYDDLLQRIMKDGVLKKNRTGVDTLSIFGTQTRYRIDEYFPLITRRKLWPKSILAELLWIISGSTNIRDLQALGSHIWDAWQDPLFEQKHGFVEGSLGPVYGFQLRHFGGYYNLGYPEITLEYEGEFSTTKYGAEGFDQLQNMVELIRNDPDSRRNLFSLWNPQDLDEQKLACCHVMFQVDVTDGKLSGMLTQRSCDYFVGGPANVLAYSALLYMLAQQCGLKPYEFVHSIADTHIYVNQLDAVQEYLSREIPSIRPKLILKRKPEDIFSYKLDDFQIADYKPLGLIKVPVAV